MSESRAAISLLMTVISNDESDKLLEILNVVPINVMTLDATNKLLLMLLTQCVNYPTEDCVKTLIDQWKLRVSGESMGLPGVESRMGRFIRLEHKMFLEALYWGDEILAILVSSLNITFFELMRDLIDYKYTLDTNIACDFAFRLVSFTYDNLTELMKIMDSYGDPANYNFQVYQCISIKVMELAPLAPKPKWIFPDVSDRNMLPTLDELDVEVKFIQSEKLDENTELLDQLDLRKLIDWVTDHTKSQLIDIQESDGDDAVRVIIAEQIDRLSESQLDSLIRRTVELQTADSLYSNSRLGQIQGPDNSGVSAEPEESVAGKYRMFPCTIFDYDEDINDFGDLGDVFDWFDPYDLGHGNCQSCLLRIAHRWWAVRIPTEKGGWKGSYCSWSCTQDAAKGLYSAEKLFVVILKILVIARNIDALGIQDRRPNPVIPKKKKLQPAGFDIFI